MDTHAIAPITTTVARLSGQPDRRHGIRTPTLFSLFYSYMDETLSIDLPGMEKPFFIAHSRVSWVEGSQFGVEMESLTLEQQNHLRFFL
jgi:hypothetical protein